MKKTIELINECQSKGVRLIFVLLPKYYSMEAMGLFNAIPEKNKIELSNPELYPEFYSKKYSYDIGHLNTLGAQLLTKKLAEKFNQSNHE